MKHSIKHLALTVLLAFVSLSAAAADYDFMVDSLYYKVVSLTDLTCEVVAGDTKYTGDVVIPATVTYNGRTLSVTSIGEEAFYKCSSLISVEIGNSVTSIGESAFEYCKSLTSVKIPNSVTSIGESAFEYCSSLTSVKIPNSVKSIYSYAFRNCSSLTSVEIPNSVTSIGYQAFCNCSSLTAVEIPNSVKSIGSSAFSGCSSLTAVEIPNSVKSIGGGAFSGCSSLTSVEIPNSVTSIGERAFWLCSSLEAFRIPSSVTKIGYCAVVGSGIKEIEIGKGIKSLPYYNEKYTQYGLFSSSGSNSSSWGTCDSLKKIVIVDSNEDLFVPASYYNYKRSRCEMEFNALPALEYLYIGRNLTHSTTEYGRYISNTHLKKIEYGDSVTVEEKASGCTGLEEIVYGKGISEISPSNISQDSLVAIYVKADTPPTVSGTFTNKTYLNVKLYVPRASLAAYQAADVWKNFWNIEAYDYASGIEVVTTKDDAPKGIYDLQGRKLSAPQKGINIVDGKKVIVK